MVKNPPGNARDVGWSLGWEDYPGGGHGYPLQYACLENPMDSRAWQVMVHRFTKSQTQLKWLSTAHAGGKKNGLERITGCLYWSVQCCKSKNVLKIMSIKKDVLLCRFDRGKILLLYLYPEMFVRVIRSVRFSVHENHLQGLMQHCWILLPEFLTW